MNVSGYSIRQTLQGPFDALVIDNAVLRLTIMPELGGEDLLANSAGERS